MQWRQLDHTQTICTSVLTDNHNNTSSLNFYRPDALPDVQPTVSSTEGKVAAVLVVNDHIAVASYGTTLTRAGYFSTSQLAVTCPANIAMGGLSQHLIAGCSGTPKFSPQAGCTLWLCVSLLCETAGWCGACWSRVGLELVQQARSCTTKVRSIVIVMLILIL